MAGNPSIFVPMVFMALREACIFKKWEQEFYPTDFFKSPKLTKSHKKFDKNDTFRLITVPQFCMILPQGRADVVKLRDEICDTL
jgi:hypothetical protein